MMARSWRGCPGPIVAEGRGEKHAWIRSLQQRCLGSEQLCASQQNWMPNVRFGSEADIGTGATNVRFTPNGGHRNSAAKCPLCAKSGHGSSHHCRYSITSSASARVVGRELFDGGHWGPASKNGFVLPFGPCLIRRSGSAPLCSP